MTTSSTPTAFAVSPDSGEHWSKEGAWKVAEGIHRIPLPLPMDGLKAINVYVIETDDGLTLIDGGWSIEVARDLLERCLRDVGYGFGDIKRFLVTHVHRDHFTLATVLGHEYGADVALGLGEKPALDLLNDPDLNQNPFLDVLRTAGAARARRAVGRWCAGEAPDTVDVDVPRHLARRRPSQIPVGARTIDAVHTPGHTPGHYVFAEQGRRPAVRRRPRAARRSRRRSASRSRRRPTRSATSWRR